MNDALPALRVLSLITRAFEVARAHVISGYKVGSTKENPATFGLAQMMRGDIAGLKQVQTALDTGISSLAVAASAGTQISDKLNEIKAKVVAAQEPWVDRALIQADIQRLLSEVDGLAAAASFNGVNLLRPGGSAAVVTSSLNRTSSTTVAAATTVVGAQPLSVSGLGLSGLNVGTNTAVTFTPTQAANFVDFNTFQFTVGGIRHVFEETDGNEAPATVTTPTVAVHVVDVLPTDTVNQRLDKMFRIMPLYGFTAVRNNNGSFTVSANGPITALTVTAPGMGAGPIGAALPQQLAIVEAAINTTKSAIGTLGIAQNALQAESDQARKMIESISNGLGIMVDADLTEEAAMQTVWETRKDLAMQSVGVINRQQSVLLTLFK